jgi:2',3'-cyclic-nucleotide 2'-phosphodiesterase (5'-nucleotidase family)
MKIAARLLIAAALASFSLTASAEDVAASSAPAVPGAIVIHIYHTNDVHGWIMPRPDKLQLGRQVGGAAAFKSLVDRDKGPKLVLDAGDWWQGTPEGSLSKGASVVDVFNAVGYDAVEVGNHEFDSGAENLRALIAALKMPVLAANVYGPDGKHVPWTKERIIKDVGGVKVGVFGLLTVHMDKLAFPKNIAGLTFRREIDEARDQVKALKAEGAEVIVALTHVGFEPADKPGYEGDKAIAREVEGIDLIVGGHSHTSLVRPWRDPDHGTLVVQAGYYLTKAGITTLNVDPASHHVASSDDKLIELWPDALGQNAAVKAVVDGREAEVGEAFKLVVATAAADLARGSNDRESGLGDWMADCYRDQTGADVAFQNGGGMRADIPAGPVTLRTLFNVMPFENFLVKLTMTGAQIRAALDRGVGMGRIVQVSGVKAEYRRKNERGQRLAKASVGRRDLDDAKAYSVVTIDFLVDGGDGYEEFAGASAKQPTGVLARDALRACAEKQKKIEPPESGRLTDLGE